MNKSLTLTVLINATSNYGEGLGNISSIQKLPKNGKTYGIRTKESLKYAIMTESGLYDDLKIILDKVAQNHVTKDENIINYKSLEGGYMNTTKDTYKRESSFSITDAVSTTPFSANIRFCTNLGFATKYAKDNNLNVQKDAKKVGLNPYQYEIDKGLKMYSITIDLERIGKDENFNIEIDNKEKAERVNAILKAIENLTLLVKGNLDNAEPLFVVGGLSERKTHIFENLLKVNGEEIIITDDLKNKIETGNFKVGIMQGIFKNENEIIENLPTTGISKLFKELEEDVINYYK